MPRQDPAAARRIRHPVDRRPTISKLPPALGALALLAAHLGALAGFYLTLLALAGLIGCCFAGYLRWVGGGSPLTVVEAVAGAVAAGLLMASCALRFPDVVSGTVPVQAARLATTAFALTWSGPLALLAVPAGRAAGRSARRRVEQRVADRRLARRLRQPADAV